MNYQELILKFWSVLFTHIEFNLNLEAKNCFRTAPFSPLNKQTFFLRIKGEDRVMVNVVYNCLDLFKNLIFLRALLSLVLYKYFICIDL
jgi:hypothetical protein